MKPRCDPVKPVLAHVVCIAGEKAIDPFLTRVADIRANLKAVKRGYRFLYGPKHLSNTIALPYVDYSSWSNEQINDGLFGD